MAFIWTARKLAFGQYNIGQGGDLIDLWMATKRLELPAALDDIRAWLGVERPKLHKPRRTQWKRPARPKCAAPSNRAMAYLTEDRNLPREILQAYKISKDDQQRIVFPFLLPDGTLAMAKRRELRGWREAGIPTEAGCEAVLFGWQAIPPNARTVVICEGEIDALSMAAYGHPAMSVPYGGGGGDKQKWIESEYDRFDRFERIYLALDMDGPGEEAAVEIANQLGRHRCVRVSMSRKDANQCLMDGIPKAEIDAAIEAATWFDIVGYVRSKFYGQAERAISNGQLNVLLRLHIRPINVVVFHGPSEGLSPWEISS